MNLIEISISMAIGFLLMFSGSRLYLDIKSNYISIMTIHQLESDMRFIVPFLNQRIRMAGLENCVVGKTVNLDKAITVYTAKNVPSEFGIQPLKDSDVLVIGQCLQYQQKNQFLMTAYFVSNTARQFRGKYVLGFFMKTLGSQREELAENIDKFNVVKNGFSGVDYALDFVNVHNDRRYQVKSSEQSKEFDDA